MSQKRHLTTANEVVHIVQDLKTMSTNQMKSFYGIEPYDDEGKFYDPSEDKVFESADDFANWFVDLEIADGGFDDPLVDKYADEGEFY